MKRGKGRDMAAEYAAVREILKPFVERAEAAEAAHREAAAQWQDEARLRRAAEAEVERLRRLDAANIVMLQGNVEEMNNLKAKLGEARSEVERLRGVPDTLHRPDADHLRGLEGDQTEVDRYWMGWTDALDRVSAALRGER